MAGHHSPEDARIAMALLRLLRGWSQTEVANAAGLSPSAISRYENGAIAPSDETVEEIARVVGLPARMLDPMLSWIGAARAAMANAAQPADRDRRIDAIVREASVGLSDLLHSTVTLALNGFPDAETGPWTKPAPTPSPTDRQEAPALWEALRRRTPSERLLLVDELQRFRHWALCELLCDESTRAVTDGADSALELAELALRIAGLVPGEELWRQRLQGYAWAHIGQALSAQGDLPAATQEAFARAEELWRAGAAGDPGLLDEGKLPHGPGRSSREAIHLSGLIGCGEAEAGLSATYKSRLPEGLGRKPGHR